MTEGIGKALASAIKEDTPPVSESRGGNTFLNLHRRSIFSLLTLNPCIGITELAEKCGLAPNSVEWHIGTLIRAGYIVKHITGTRRVFFPDGLITQDQAELFQTINHPRNSILLSTVMLQPGLSQTDIAIHVAKSRQWVAKGLDELEAAGVVSVVSDGNNLRHYPTKLLPEKAEDFYRHSKDFADYMLKQLAREGGRMPVVVKKSLSKVVIEAGQASDRFSLEIGINPYMTCLSCR